MLVKRAQRPRGIVLVCRIRFTSNEDYVRFIHKLISLNEVEYQMEIF